MNVPITNLLNTTKRISKSRYSNRNKNKTKDPATAIVAATNIGFKIGSQIFNYFISKNYSEALEILRSLKAKVLEDKFYIDSGEIMVCSSVKLIINVTNFTYMNNILQSIFTEAYIKYIPLNENGLSENSDKRKRVLSNFLEQKKIAENIYKHTITEMEYYLKASCQQNFSDVLSDKNEELERKMIELEKKIAENEFSLFEGISEGFTVGIKEKGEELVVPDLFKKNDDNEDKNQFLESWNKITAATDFLKSGSEVLKSLNQLINDNDERTKKWVSFFVNLTKFLGSSYLLIGENLSDGPLKLIFETVGNVLKFFGVLIETIFAFIQWKSADNQEDARENKKEFYMKLKELFMALGSIFLDAFFSLLGDSINFVFKVYELFLSRKALRKAKNESEFFNLYGEMLKEKSAGYNRYNLCGIKYSYLDFIFKTEQLNYEESNTFVNKLKQTEIRKYELIMGDSEARDFVKENIKNNLCAENVQFCSKLFSEEFMLAFFEKHEIDQLKYEAIYGPYSDIVTIVSNDNSELKNDQYIAFSNLGYEPIKSWYSNKTQKPIFVMGCRRCSKKIIRHVQLIDKHDEFEEKFGQEKTCSSEEQICKSIYSDPKCITSDFRSIRISLFSKNAILAYELVNLDEKFTPALSKLFLYTYNNIEVEMNNYKAIWINDLKKFYDCDNSSISQNTYCLNSCTKSIFHAPKEITTDTKINFKCGEDKNPKNAFFIIDQNDLINGDNYEVEISLDDVYQVSLRREWQEMFKQIKIVNYSNFEEFKKIMCYFSTDEGIQKYSLTLKNNDSVLKRICSKRYFSYLIDTKNSILQRYSKNFIFEYQFENSNKQAKLDITGNCEGYSDASHKYNADDRTKYFSFVSKKPFSPNSDKINSSKVDKPNIFQFCDDICVKKDDICLFRKESKFDDAYSISVENKSEFKTLSDDTFYKISENKIYKFIFKHENNTVQNKCLIFEKEKTQIKILNYNCNFKDNQFPLKGIQENFYIIPWTNKEDIYYYQDYKNLKKDGFINYKNFNFKSGDYNYHFLFKPLPSAGIANFRDYNYARIKDCQEFVNNLIYKQILTKGNKITEYSGDSFEKFYVLQKNGIKYTLESLINLIEYNKAKLASECRRFSIFVPVTFSKQQINNQQQTNKHSYKQLKIIDNIYQETLVNYGPQIRKNYWVQIAYGKTGQEEFEKNYNNPNNLKNANQFGFLPLKEIKTKYNGDYNYFLRPWVQFDFRLIKNKRDICKVCSLKKLEKTIKLRKIISKFTNNLKQKIQAKKLLEELNNSIKAQSLGKSFIKKLKNNINDNDIDDDLDISEDSIEIQHDHDHQLKDKMKNFEKNI